MRLKTPKILLSKHEVRITGIISGESTVKAVQLYGTILDKSSEPYKDRFSVNYENLICGHLIVPSQDETYHIEEIKVVDNLLEIKYLVKGTSVLATLSMTATPASEFSDNVKYVIWGDL